LDANYLQLPVNRPIVPANNNQRDGAMHIDKPIKKRVVENLTKADPELGKYVAKGIKL